MAKHLALKKFNLNHHAAYVFLLATLAACSDGDTKVAALPGVDTAAPRALHNTPADGASGVALNSVLTATFSDAINPATLTPSTFTVNGVKGRVKVSGDQRSASFTPATALKPSTHYTVTLTTGIQDTAGNTLCRNIRWSFTTRAAARGKAPARRPVEPFAGPIVQQAVTVTNGVFHKPLNCSTLSADCFYALETGEAVFGFAECGGHTVSFKPLAGLSIPTSSARRMNLSPVIMYLADSPISAYSWPFGTVGIDSAKAIASDVAGNVYAAGYASLKFFSGTGLAGQASAGSAELFISKYDASGERQWNRQLGTAGDSSANAIASDAAGNVYAAGYTSGALDGQTSAGGGDLFVTKYDASGLKQWTRQLGTAASDIAYTIASDAAGSVYAAGYTNGALDGQSSAGGADLFITKYDARGLKQWTRQLGTAGSDYAKAITSDAAGYVYVAGYTNGALDGQTSAGGYDLFVAKYDASGVKQWISQLGTAGVDTAYAITSDAAGNVYAAGYTSGALDAQSSAGGADLFIVKYDASGVKQWTRQLGTAGYDTAQAITTDAAGNVYAAGYTSGALDGQSSAGGADLFVAKYDASGVKQWTRQLGTAGYDTAQAISSDAAGNVSVAGYTSGALDGQSRAGDADLFIVKY